MTTKKKIVMLVAISAAASLAIDYYMYTKAKKKGVNKLGVFAFDASNGEMKLFVFDSKKLMHSLGVNQKN